MNYGWWHVSSHFRPKIGVNSSNIGFLHSQNCLRGTSAVPLEPTNDGGPQIQQFSGVKCMWSFVPLKQKMLILSISLYTITHFKNRVSRQVLVTFSSMQGSSLNSMQKIVFTFCFQA
jgi:hypothetical protein